MREILFRGKNEASVWHYGAYLPYESGEVAILESFSKYGYEAVELSQRCKVIPETVGQYTGLTDKNGKKIFEGDIIKNTWTGDTHTVDWCVDCAVWVLPCITDERRETTFDSYDGDDYEVIGNIHDNSELLKGGVE